MSLHGSPHPPERAHHGAVAAPFSVSSVLSGAQEILAPPVVGVLVENPVALHDVAGVNVMVTETIVHVGAVIHEFHHVSHHVGPVVCPHPVGSPVLQVKEITT